VRRRRSPTPELDFLVIGAQKAGTTSLWRYLEDNPHIRMPPDKEAPFFTEPAYPDGLRSYMRALFKDAPRRAMLGTVTPYYMVGANGVDVPEVAARIHRTAPAVRLIALLRDPVARALSSYRMSVRRHGERRSFPEAVRELLRPDELERARRAPTPTNTYVAGGEYGRILTAYRDVFPRGQLLVELSRELEREPAQVVERVCAHIGVPAHEPARLGGRFFTGGQPLVPAEAEADLKRYLDRHVWPRVRHAEQHRQAFEHWFRLWNTGPSPASETVDDATAAALREHFAADARELEAATGVRGPWTEPG
jgi:hypothetical protein